MPKKTTSIKKNKASSQNNNNQPIVNENNSTLNDFSTACKEENFNTIQALLEDPAFNLGAKNNQDQTALAILLIEASKNKYIKFTEILILALEKYKSYIENSENNGFNLNSKDLLGRNIFDHMYNFINTGIEIAKKSTFNQEEKTKIYSLLYLFYRNIALYGDDQKIKMAFSERISTCHSQITPDDQSVRNSLNLKEINASLLHAIDLVTSNNREEILFNFIDGLDVIIYKNDLSLLLLAACQTDNHPIAMHLLNKPIPIRNALSFAMTSKADDLMKKIIEHEKYDVNFIDAQGKAALHYACGLGYLECTKLLLDKSDIQLNIQTLTEGMTPLMYALDSYTITPGDKHRCLVIAKMIIEKTPLNDIINIKSKGEHSALIYFFLALEKLKNLVNTNKEEKTIAIVTQIALLLIEKFETKDNSDFKDRLMAIEFDSSNSISFSISANNLEELHDAGDLESWVQHNIINIHNHNRKEEIIDWLIRKMEDHQQSYAYQKNELQLKINSLDNLLTNTNKLIEINTRFDVIHLFIKTVKGKIDQSYKTTKSKKKLELSKLFNEQMQNILIFNKLITPLIENRERVKLIKEKLEETLHNNNLEVLKSSELCISRADEIISSLKTVTENIGAGEDLIRTNKNIFEKNYSYLVNDINLKLPNTPSCLQADKPQENNVARNRKSAHKKKSPYSQNITLLPPPHAQKLGKSNLLNNNNSAQEHVRTLTLAEFDEKFPVLKNLLPVNKESAIAEYGDIENFDHNVEKEFIDHWLGLSRMIRECKFEYLSENECGNEPAIENNSNSPRF